MKIKPIRTQKDHRQALRRIEELWDARKGTPGFDELDILSALVAAYEATHHEILPPDPIEAIRFRMEQLGLSNSDVAEFFGGSNRVSEVLRRRRKLTMKMVRNLHRELGIPAESLIA